MASENEFYGTGWNYPPQFVKTESTAKTVMVSGQENITQSLRVLLTTNLNERLMRPNYGGGLDLLLFAPIDQRTITKIQNTISDAVLLYEPRVDLVRVQVDNDDIEAGLLKINIEYTTRETNSRFNLVYPFYINEALSAAIQVGQ